MQNDSNASSPVSQPGAIAGAPLSSNGQDPLRPPKRKRRPPKSPEQRYRATSISLHPFDMRKLEHLAASRILTNSGVIAWLLSKEPDPFPDAKSIVTAQN